MNRSNPCVNTKVFMNQRESSEMHKAKSIEAIHIIISIISTNECASQMLKANNIEAACTKIARLSLSDEYASPMHKATE